MKSLSDIAYEELLCLAYRHRWVPRAAQAGVVGGTRVWDWELKCETGCGARATEWRDNFGARLPGTSRQYYHTQSYRQATGYSQGEYIMELARRQRKVQHRGSGAA